MTVRVPRRLVVALIAADVIVVLALPMIVTWIVWHGGAIDNEPIEDRVMSTWTVWFMALLIVTGAGALAHAYDHLVIDPGWKGAQARDNFP